VATYLQGLNWNAITQIEVVDSMCGKVRTIERQEIKRETDFLFNRKLTKRILREGGKEARFQSTFNRLIFIFIFLLGSPTPLPVLYPLP